MQIKYKLILSLSLVLIMLVVTTGVAQAKHEGGPECSAKWHLGCPIIPTECTDNLVDSKVNGVCDFTDMATTMIHIAQWLLAVVGAVSFGYFVYGGFVLMTAAGNTSQVDHGRRILIGTVVGLFIVLGSFQLVGWVGTLFGGGATPTGFDKFLDTGPSQCLQAGNACKLGPSGENVYACDRDGTCSGINLCVYWAGRPGERYDLTILHTCISDVINCKSDPSPQTGLCPNNDFCCEPK